MAAATLVLVTGSSAPPDVTQIGLPQWTLAVAMPIAPMMPTGPTGLRKPSNVNTPPPNSDAPATSAHARPGRSDSDSIMLAVLWLSLAFGAGRLPEIRYGQSL